MPEDVDKSLLARLQALRGASEPPESISSKINIDPIERSKTPTREDTLAARLKSLRSQDSSPQAKPTPPPPPSSRQTHQQPPPPYSASSTLPKSGSKTSVLPSIEDDDGDEFEKSLQTDDKDLEELLGDVEGDESFAVEAGNGPSDEKVKALLEELAASMPKDGDEEKRKGWKEKEGERVGSDDDDDSDGERMQGEVDDVIARFRDGAEIDAAREKDEKHSLKGVEDEEKGQDHTTDTNPAEITLPDVPADLQPPDTTTAPSNTDISSLTDRLAALRTPSAAPDPSDILPSVPTSAPMKQPDRLVSTTKYTDEDMEGWCTVCLEDATLKCLGCDDDPYCHRCWREMHVGPRARVDERGHRAVQFSKGERKEEEEKRMALGAS